MKALVVREFGPSPTMGIEERPKPIVRQGSSLIKMHAATINPLSHQVRTGMVTTAKAPMVLSNDGSGIVVESDRFAKGTSVAIYGAGIVGVTQDGLQQEWVVVEDKYIIELPRDFDLDLAAALPINYVTSFQALNRVGQVERGQTVLVSGASGALGNALIQTARAFGAVPIGIVSSAAKVKRAQDAGAYAVIDLSSQDLRKTVLDLTEGRGADLAMDPVGGDLLGSLLSALRTRGAVVSIGFVGGVKAALDLIDVVVYEKRVLGYDAWLETESDVAAAIEAIKGLLADGLLRPSIDSSFEMTDFEAGYGRLLSRQATGAILLRL